MGGCVREVEVVDPVDGHDVDVEMGNLQTGDHQTDLARRKGSFDGPADPRRHVEEVVTQLRRGIEPVVDLFDRHHQSVALPERVDRHERHAAIVPPHEGAGDLAFDDAGEDGRHGARVLPAAHRSATSWSTLSVVRTYTSPEPSTPNDT